MANKKKSVKVITNDIKNKPYFSFETRSLIYSLITIICLIIGGVLLANNIIHQKEIKITYTEKGDINYNTTLKNNQFFDKKTLDNDNTDLYISSLIDKINLNFNYDFNISRAENINFVYDISADIFIQDQNGKFYGSKNLNNKAFKHYVLYNVEKNDNKYDLLDFKINKDIIIDYQFYNKLANDFTKTYNLDTNNYLLVSLNIYNQSVDINDLNTYKTLSIKIPLNETTIAFDVNKDDVNKVTFVTQEGYYYIKNNSELMVGILFIFLAVIVLLQLIHLLRLAVPKENKYNKNVNKLLKQYDYIIVNTKTLPKFDNCDIIKISDFDELIDVHDNLKLPIMYCEVTRSHKCNFYIKDNNTIYLLVMKNTE